MIDDPYYWENEAAMIMWLADRATPSGRALGRANSIQDNSALDLDDCYSDEIIPTRPRNRMRPMVKSLT